MKYKFVLWPIAFFLLGVSMTYAQSSGEPGSKAFHFSSRGTAFGVQGEFEGTYLIHDDSIEVSITKATIYVSENCPYQGRRSIKQEKNKRGYVYAFSCKDMFLPPDRKKSSQ